MFEEYDPTVRRNLFMSKRATSGLEERRIKCPKCGFYLCRTYGRIHCCVSVVCDKCKFREVIDLALFRTMKLKEIYNEKEGYWFVPTKEAQPA